MKLDHVGIFTGHPRRMLTFYLNKLGFKKDYQTILSDDVVFSIFRVRRSCHMVRLSCDETRVEIFWFSAGRHPASRLAKWAGYNHFSIEVENKQSFCEKLAKKSGVRIIRVERSGSRTYFLEDPDKNLIEIREPPKDK